MSQGWLGRVDVGTAELCGVAKSPLGVIILLVLCGRTQTPTRQASPLVLAPVSPDFNGIVQSFLALTAAAGLEVRDQEQAADFFAAIFTAAGAEDAADFWAEVDLEVGPTGQQVAVEARFPLPTPTGSIHPLELAEAYQVIDGWLRQHTFQTWPEVRFAGGFTRQAEVILDEFYLRRRWQLTGPAEGVWGLWAWDATGPTGGWREVGRWPGLEGALEAVAGEVAATLRRLTGEGQLLAAIF